MSESEGFSVNFEFRLLVTCFNVINNNFFSFFESQHEHVYSTTNFFHHSLNAGFSVLSFLG